MGLDMFLLRKKEGKKEHAGYWRKANQIHAWFVENVQEGEDDCGEYPVSYEVLKNLLDICKIIKSESVMEDKMIQNGSKMVGGVWVPIMVDGKVISNPDLAESLLPTKKGFFFGNTDYDEGYMYDIDRTIEICENALKNPKDEYFYSSSW